MVLQSDLEELRREMTEAIVVVVDSHAEVFNRIVGLLERVYERLEWLEAGGASAPGASAIAHVDPDAPTIATEQ